MADEGGELALIVRTWTRLIRGGEAGELGRILDDHVIWQGLRPELVCHSRAEVLERLDRFRAHLPHITRLEAQEAGDRVAVSVEGSDFPATEVQPVATPRSLVFIFRDGRVIRMESYSSRDAAFATLA